MQRHLQNKLNEPAMKPKKIFLIRHGESKANIDHGIYAQQPAHLIPLTDKGYEQARECGDRLAKMIAAGRIFFYLSPYLRTRQTFECIISRLGDVAYKLREEPRIREQDFGNPADQAVDLRYDPDFSRCGAFFYRFKNGECGADVYDRISSFFYTLHRNFQKPDYPENTVIITHGMLMRLFVMRWYHLSVEEFEAMDNPPNCHIVTMTLNGSTYQLEEPVLRKNILKNNN